MSRWSRTVLWRNEAFHMYEFCAFKDTREAFHFEGVVVTVEEERPVRITYQVVFDRQGLTQSVGVDAVGGQRDRHLQLIVDERRTWVRFPQFDIVPFPQRHTRLDANRYRYENQYAISGRN